MRKMCRKKHDRVSPHFLSRIWPKRTNLQMHFQFGYIVHIILVLFCIFFVHETMYAIGVLAEFDFYYRTSACNLTELENLQYSECPFRFVSGFSSLLTL